MEEKREREQRIYQQWRKLDKKLISYAWVHYQTYTYFATITLTVIVMLLFLSITPDLCIHQTKNSKNDHKQKEEEQIKKKKERKKEKKKR